jgi:S1-C subfamily serine protease
VIKEILKIISILILGAIGGLLFQFFVIPYLITNPYFERFQFVKILKEREIIVNPKEEITVTITENVALEKAIEKVKDSIVFVQSKSKTGKILEGSGLILTSDGLILTLSDLVPQNYQTKIFLNNKEFVPKVLQRKNNLALLKIEERNLKTISFVDLEKIKLGERVFLLGIVSENNLQKAVVNEGIIKTFDEKLIQTNISESKNLQGSPLFDIEGQLVGLNTIDKEGKILAISIKEIRQFIGF